MDRIETIMQQLEMKLRQNHLVKKVSVKIDPKDEKDIVYVKIKLMNPRDHLSDLTQLMNLARTKIPKNYKIDLVMKSSM